MPWDRGLIPALGGIAVLRLLASLLLAWGVGRLLGLQGVGFKVFVMDCAFPTAVLVGVLATEFDADPEFATLCIFVTTLSSLVTVPLVLHWVGG